MREEKMFLLNHEVGIINNVGNTSGEESLVGCLKCD